MRKIFSLLVISAVAGFFTAPVFASNADDLCEDLKGEAPGLYGLCIAYQNAESPQARDSIEAAFDKKADKAGWDEPIPGSGPTCPCFGPTDLAEAQCNHSYVDAGTDFLIYDEAVFGVLVVEGVLSQCFYRHDPVDALGDIDVSLPATVDEIDACRMAIFVATDMELNPDPDNPLDCS